MKNKGFTLIELLVVVGIIAVLSAVVISAYSGEPKCPNGSHTEVVEYKPRETTEVVEGQTVDVVYTRDEDWVEVCD